MVHISFHVGTANILLTTPVILRIPPIPDVPGWSSDTEALSSGVESNGYVGTWNGYVMAGTCPDYTNPDPPVWQLTNHTIGGGEEITLAVVARIGWMSTGNDGAVLGDTATYRMTIYYDNGGTRVSGSSSYAGLLDKASIYSYSLDPADVAMLYTDVMGGNICVGGNPEYDLTDDCRVDLEDFAMLATGWMECNLVPDCMP